jgi:hypothetical protein
MQGVRGSKCGELEDWLIREREKKRHLKSFLLVEAHIRPLPLPHHEL